MAETSMSASIRHFESIISNVRLILPMTNIDITRMSSKGQIVIPAELRQGIKEGDKLVIIRNKDQLILKKADSFDKNLSDDLEFADRTEKAWKDYQKGKFISKTKDEFRAGLDKW
ncbi:MAG TPA: AbrB/MazE/SpoVT family DNA-binding domain-containing protein [Candidatus Micrarchaeota archaeon]|nr:AbrB/MazE/SpoVT family DNA-binding domain-containing protein [Candidatus Micrarchaeota archaeon]